MTRPRFSTLRRTLVAAGLATASLGALQAQAPQNIVFWYHFDNPEQTKVMDGLVADFQAKNPGIKVDAQNIPWNNYYDRLFTAVAGGKSPDVAMVKLQQQAQLVEMGALEPIDTRVAAWPGRNDLGDNLLNINKGHDGKQYYLPLQYVVIYLYYRADLFQKPGCSRPRPARPSLTPPRSSPCRRRRTAARRSTALACAAAAAARTTGARSCCRRWR
jgi:multiple sugar transport system substrate-binding protein